MSNYDDWKTDPDYGLTLKELEARDREIEDKEECPCCYGDEEDNT
jgi:hypothetical protein